MTFRASNAVAFSALEVTKGICLLYSRWIFLVSFLTSDETEIDKSKSFCSSGPRVRRVIRSRSESIIYQSASSTISRVSIKLK